MRRNGQSANGVVIPVAWRKCVTHVTARGMDALPRVSVAHADAVYRRPAGPEADARRIRVSVAIEVAGDDYMRRVAPNVPPPSSGLSSLAATQAVPVPSSSRSRSERKDGSGGSRLSSA